MRLSLLLVLAIAGASCDRGPAAGPDASASGGGARPGGGTTWATYHGDFALDGIADAALPDAPEKLWKVKVEGRVDSTPLAADGRIYFTSTKGGLYCLDFSGKEIWRSCGRRSSTRAWAPTSRTSTSSTPKPGARSCRP